MTKEKEVILHVLDMYKHMPFLWDRNHTEYKNKVSRINGQQMLLEVYKEYDKYATIQTLNKKIQNLKTNYYKEFQKVKESQINATDENDIYEPSLWYYDALSFLGDNSEHRRRKRDPLKTETVSPSSSDAEGSYQNSETYTTVSTPPMRRKKLKKSVHHLYNVSTNNIKDDEIKTIQMKDDEWEILGKSISLQLRDLDKTQLTITHKIISDAIYYAKFGMLTQQSYIHLGTPPAPPP